MMWGDGFEKAIVHGLIALFIFAFSLGALAVWGIPKLWGLIKPFLHSITG